MAYGIVKVDNITFDNGGSDQNVTVSGLYRATTSGVTVSGTIAATTVSGVTVIGSTTVSGATVTGTTANFTSGNFSNIISSAATMSGALIMASQQQVRFRELDNTNHIALQAPEIVSADQTITLPDQTGTVVTTGDNGSVTSTMILDGTILNANISASAAIADTKLATISTAGKVSGTAITSGTIATSGELRITNNTPAVSLTESDGTATHSQSLLVRSNNQFIIQTRNSAGVTLSNDYSIPANASGATDHIWRIANTEKARLNSAGLTVVNDLTISDKIIHAGDTNTAIRFPAADTVTVETNGSERARIDSNGRLLVGTSSTPPAVETIVPQFVSSSAAGVTGAGDIAIYNFQNAGGVGRTRVCPKLLLGNSRSGTNGSLGGIVPNNEHLGNIRFAGDDGSAFITAAEILAGVDGTPGTNDMPGRLVFSTTADGASSPTERMRITSAGNVGIGTTSPSEALNVVGNILATGRVRSKDGTTGDVGLGFTDDHNLGLYRPASDTLGFVTGSSERLRIDSSGRLLVGTSTNSAVSTLVLQGNSTSSVGASFLFLQRGVSVPGTNDSLGVLTFGNNASNLGAQILSSRDGGTWTSGTSHPGRLLFFTTADGNSSPTERMRITSAGNVGIGTIAGTGKLEVAVSGNRTIGNQWDNKSILIGTPGAFSGNLGLSFDTTNGATIESAAPGVASYPVRIAGSEIQLFTASTERVRIDSSGRLLVGVTSARNNFLNSTADPHIQLEGLTRDTSTVSTTRVSDDAGGCNFFLAKSRGAAIGSNTVVVSSDTLGSISFQGNDGAEFVSAASISAAVDGTPGANDMPGRLVFSTTADGASTPTERMRITKDGGFMVGQTVTVAPGYGNGTVGAGFSNTDKVLYVSSSNPALRLNRNSDGSIVDFRRSGSAGVVGTISVTTTATAYNTSSDYRLKENVVPLDGAIARLNQLPVHRFNFIADPDTVVDGFIAHEAQAVVPECVTGEKDAVDDDGNPVYQGIDQSKLVPLLTAALQEAVAKIESLEARLTAAGL